MTTKDEQKVTQQIPETGSYTRAGNIKNSSGIAVGDGATAVHVKAIGDVGDLVTGTKISLVNQASEKRVASTRQIAAPPDDYISRPTVEAELKAVLTAESDSLRIVDLYGLPGVGKSWLARKLGKELEDTFVDGTLWANLERTTLRSAIWHFIEPYDDNISNNSLASATEYVAAMEKAFGEKRILMVLDQMQKLDSLMNWLPSKSKNCVVLLISQQPLSFIQKQESSYQLTGMAEAEAAEMFAHLLRRGDDAKAHDDISLQALAEKLDYIPAAINAVARDLVEEQMTPKDYLEALSSGRENGSLRSQLPGLKTVHDNLPDTGKSLFPFLGILHSVSWTPDDLYAISRKSSSDIEAGLKQLLRVGLVDKRPSGRYRTPTTISNFALVRLEELGGQQLVDATTALQVSDVLQKAELVLRYVRQALLKECWQAEDDRDLLIQSITEQFSGHLPATRQEVDDTSMLAIPRDPLLDFFENLVLKDQAHRNRWIDMLEAANFPVLRRQLEEAFNWAFNQEDWLLLRRFATDINVNTEWIIDSSFIGKKEEHNWMQFELAFPLLKNLEVTDFELTNVVLMAPNIKVTSWVDCHFIATKWPGAYLMSSRFIDVDMVGMELPGGVVTNCKFADVDARFGDFRGTVFQKCSFQNVNFREAKFENAKFIDCSFNMVDFRLTVLEEVFT